MRGIGGMIVVLTNRIDKAYFCIVVYGTSQEPRYTSR
jgi:hypothetical protein